MDSSTPQAASVCNICEQVGEAAAATMSCNTCSNTYCPSCWAKHDAVMMTKGTPHSGVEIDGGARVVESSQRASQPAAQPAAQVDAQALHLGTSRVFNENCKAGGLGLRMASINELGTFIIVARDSEGNMCPSDLEEFFVTIENDPFAHVVVTNGKQGLHTVRYRLSSDFAGASVRLNVQHDSKHILGSPFAVPLSTALDAGQCTASGFGLYYTCVGEELQHFTLQLCEVSGIKRARGGDITSIAAHIIGQEESYRVALADNGDGTYKGLYKADKSLQSGGGHRIQVLVNGVDVRGSPFPELKSVSPKDFVVTPEAIESVRVGGLCCVEVSHQTAATSMTDFASHVQCTLDGALVASSMLTSASLSYSFTATTLGEHCLTLTVAGVHIGDSPYTIAAAHLAFIGQRSSILTAEMEAGLARVLNPTRRNLRMLLNSGQSTDQRDVRDAIRNQSKVLVIAKAITGHVFGGYIEDTFKMTAKSVAGTASENCVFSLWSSTGSNIRKYIDSANKGGFFDGDIANGFYMGNAQGELYFTDLATNCQYHPRTYTRACVGFPNEVPTSQLITGSDSPLFRIEHAEIYTCSA